MNDCTIIDSPLRYSSRRVFMPWVPLGAEEYALEFRVLGISPAVGTLFCGLSPALFRHAFQGRAKNFHKLKRLIINCLKIVEIVSYGFVA